MKIITILVALVLLSCNQNRNTKNTLDFKNSIKVETATNSYNALNTNNAARTKSDLLIAAGKSIGGTNLLDDSSTLKKFGEASFSDAAMGKAWVVWTGKGLDVTGNETTLAIYTTYNGSDMTKKVVKKIRVTSLAFKTPEGAHTGMSITEIAKLYPNLQLDTKWKKRDSHLKTNFYIVKDAGLGFEFQTINNNQICVAIVVAAADEISNVNYLILDSDEIQR